MESCPTTGSPVEIRSVLPTVAAVSWMLLEIESAEKQKMELEVVHKRGECS